MTEQPNSLTYYSSLNVISQVLTKSSLPLLEAHQLNDAFLPDKDSVMPFTLKELYDLAVKVIVSAILGKTAPRGQPNHPLQKAIMRWRLENRFNDEAEIKEALVGLLPSMVEQILNEAKKSHEDWLTYVSSKRILPLFEKFQLLELWEEKGFGLKGAAIKFKCPDGSVFSGCLPLNYTKVPATTVNAKSYIDQMLGIIQKVEFDPQNILLTQNYSRRQFKEWRLIVTNDLENEKEMRLAFSPDLIQSVYLGALVSDLNAEKLKNHLARINPKVNLFHLRCKKNEYDLEFQKISDNGGDNDEHN